MSSSSNKENDTNEAISLEAENARLRKENASLSKYELGFSRRFRVTGPNATPVYMEGTLAVDDEYYEDCCEGRVDGEMDRWYASKKEHFGDGILLVELPKLEYHIEGMHTVFRLEDELEDTKFVVSLAENGNCSIEMEHHIVWFYNETVSSLLTFDEMIKKLPDRWQMNKYGGKGAKLTLEVDQAAGILRQLFGNEAKLAKFSPQFDMNEAGGDRFMYSPDGIRFDVAGVEEKDEQKTTPDELKEENRRLEQENKHLWSCKMHCSRDVKITGAKDTPVYSNGEAFGDGAWFAEYGGILKPNPRSKGVILRDVSSLKVHVQKTSAMSVLRVNELSGVQCILTLDEDGKCSLSLQSKDFCLDSDVSTTRSFGPLNDLPSEWQHKTACFGKRVAKLEFRLFEMKTILRDVFHGDTKARAKFNSITLATRLFEDDYWC